MGEQGEQGGPICAICTEPLCLPGTPEAEQNPVRALEVCYHTYHAKCMAKWVQFKGRLVCPLCQKDNGNAQGRLEHRVQIASLLEPGAGDVSPGRTTIRAWEASVEDGWVDARRSRYNPVVIGEPPPDPVRENETRYFQIRYCGVFWVRVVVTIFALALSSGVSPKPVETQCLARNAIGAWAPMTTECNPQVDPLRYYTILTTAATLGWGLTCRGKQPGRASPYWFSLFCWLGLVVVTILTVNQTYLNQGCPWSEVDCGNFNETACAVCGGWVGQNPGYRALGYTIVVVEALNSLLHVQILCWTVCRPDPDPVDV
jgi:hypothetical protein